MQCESDRFKVTFTIDYSSNLSVNLEQSIFDISVGLKLSFTDMRLRQ